MFLLNSLIVLLAFPAAWLQLARVRKAGSSEGLSVTYVAAGTTSAATWLAYGFFADQTLQIVVNASGLFAQICTMLLIAYYAPKYRKVMLVVAGYAGVMVAGGLLIGPALVGALGSALAVSSRFPQVYTSWRQPGEGAVSVSSFGFTAAVSVLWAIFGLVDNDAFITSSSIVCVGSCLFVILRTRSVDEEAYAEESGFATA